MKRLSTKANGGEAKPLEREEVFRSGKTGQSMRGGGTITKPTGEDD